MTFAEYRALNRNIDFYTMFMSIFVPGYGLFEVERPGLAWSIVGARAVSYGLMGTAVALQWNHFYGLIDTEQLSEVDFRRFLTNSFIFGGGVILGGFTWAFDVMGAYSIAKHDKDLVQYRYGVRSTITGGLRGESNPAADERYLRRMLAQDTDDAIAETLLGDLPAFARFYPDEPFSGNALFFAALIAAERGEDLRSLLFALRSAYRYPDGERATDALRHVAGLAEANLDWGVNYDALVGLTSVPAAAEPNDRMLAMVRALGRIEALREAALEEAQRLLREHGSGVPRVGLLAAAGELLVELGRPAEAATYLAAIAVTETSAPEWAPATLALAELYLGPLEDRTRAEYLLRAILENAPESDEAARARDSLRNL
jgi:hypothetical protein